jgi:hypothetical protein
MLEQHRSKYSANCMKYVEFGGKLTAQGIANLYFYHKDLGINRQWL